MTSTEKIGSQLAEWQQLNEQRLRLDREAAAIKKRCQQLEETFEGELIKAGKPSIVRAGFTLCWVPKSASVSWSDEFIREVGPERAAQLQNAAAAQQSRKLSIVTPVG
jgi:hypothetical protein